MIFVDVRRVIDELHEKFKDIENQFVLLEKFIEETQGLGEIRPNERKGKVIPLKPKKQDVCRSSFAGAINGCDNNGFAKNAVNNRASVWSDAKNQLTKSPDDSKKVTCENSIQTNEKKQEMNGSSNLTGPLAGNKIQTKNDVMTCLECGVQMPSLVWHLKVSHGVNPEAYKRKFSLPKNYMLTVL